MTEKIYYLYRHIRLDKNIPFYIGISSIYNNNCNYISKKSKYKRAYDFIKRSKLWKKIALKTEIKVEIILFSNSIEFIEEKEKEFIKLYGRIDNKTGSLVNHNDGGFGLRGQKHSEEAKNKIRNKRLGKTSGMKNKKHSAETKKLIGLSQKGRKLTEKHKKILSDRMQGTKNPTAKFSKEDILNIRNLYSKKETNKLTQKKIALIYKTDQGTISCIVNGKKWKKL